MSEQWDFLIGYPLDEAKEVLAEENVPFLVEYTSPPFKASSSEDAYVIAVRMGEPLVIICAGTDWTVN